MKNRIMGLINKVQLSLIIFLLLIASLSNAQNIKSVNEVRAVLSLQSDRWNEGDIPGFMHHYWHSEKLQFIGSKGISFGWQNTLDNYLKAYPDKETMGELLFDIIDAQELSENIVMVSGKFTLFRVQKGDLSGHFLLVWKKINGIWVIIADHTS